MQYGRDRAQSAATYPQTRTIRGCGTYEELGNFGWTGVGKSLTLGLVSKHRCRREGLVDVGNLTNHGAEAAQHLTIYNHRRRKDW